MINVSEDVAQSGAEENADDETQSVSSSKLKWKYAGDTGAKVFHEIACESLASGTQSLVYFDSRDYAVIAGYQACETCEP